MSWTVTGDLESYAAEAGPFLGADLAENTVALTVIETLRAQGGAEQVVLFADLANPTSNGVYQRIGYRAVSDRLVLGFAER